MRLKDKIAVVTGGGQGIGRATARMFAREGAKVVIAARTEARLERVKKEIEEEGGEALAVPTDVRREEDVKRLMEATRERFGGLDVLVNNAGVGPVAPVDGMDMAEYDRLMDTNLRGMYLGCRLGVPMMKAAGRGSDYQYVLCTWCTGQPSAYGLMRPPRAELSDARGRLQRSWRRSGFERMRSVRGRSGWRRTRRGGWSRSEKKRVKRSCGCSGRR